MQRARTTASQHQSLALVKAPSLHELAEDNVLSRFLEFFATRARRSSWTLKLPQLRNNPDAHALRSSLRAVSLAYFAHVTQNRAVQVESLRHYGQSLARQRSALTRLPSFFCRLPSSAEVVSIDIDATTSALLATVILSYFELISPGSFIKHIPSSTAWINHTLASERLIAMLGPQCVSNDIVGQLFYSIRSHAVYRAAVLGHYTVFSEKEWLEAAAKHVPKQSYARSAYDRVTDWILRLCRLRFKRFNRVDLQHAWSEQTMDEEQDTAQSLLEDLKHLYCKFLEICRQVPFQEVPLFVSMSKTPPHEQSNPPVSSHGQQSSTTQLRMESLLVQEDIRMQHHATLVYCPTTGVRAEGPADITDLHPKLQKLFAAMTTACFHAAVILLHTYFPEVLQRSSEDFGGGGTGEPGDDIAWGNTACDTLYNARVVLAAGKYLSAEGRSNGTAVIRMMLPFSVVWHFCHGDAGVPVAPFEPEAGGPRDTVVEARLVRLKARDLFADWCGRKGMSGLIAVGFEELS